MPDPMLSVLPVPPAPWKGITRFAIYGTRAIVEELSDFTYSPVIWSGYQFTGEEAARRMATETEREIIDDWGTFDSWDDAHEWLMDQPLAGTEVEASDA